LNGSSTGTLRLGGHRLEEARSGPRRAAAMAAAATWLPGAALATGAPRLVRGRGQPELRLLHDVRSVLPMPSTGRGRGPGRRSRSSRRTPPPGDPLPLQVRKCARVAAAVAAARLRAAAGLRAASGRAHTRAAKTSGCFCNSCSSGIPGVRFHWSDGLIPRGFRPLHAPPPLCFFLVCTERTAHCYALSHDFTNPRPFKPSPRTLDLSTQALL